MSTAVVFPLKLRDHAPKTPREIKYEQVVAALSESLQGVVFKHLRHSGDIRRILDIRDYLIEQFHETKCIKKCRKDVCARYYPRSDIDERYQTKFLYDKDRSNSSLNDFPCQFSSELENCFFAEIPAAHDMPFWDATQIYYNWRSGLFSHRKREYAYFDPALWQLSAHPTLNAADIAMLEKFQDELLGLCESIVELTRSRLLLKELRRLQKRVGRQMSPTRKRKRQSTDDKF